MAFTPINLPIQEILQTDFIVDLAQIHNSNVLILKDKLEDLINNFEIDTNNISIGTDNPINNVRTQNIIIQDGGFIYQTGIPNQIISRLSKNVNNESVLNVDILTVDLSISTSSFTTNSLIVNNNSVLTGDVDFSGLLKYNSSIVESKETVTVPVLKSGPDAIGTLVLSNTSNKNIYVTLSADTTVGPTQVWTSANAFNSIGSMILNIDFDVNNPPLPNTAFNIYIVDIVESSGSSSILGVPNGVNASQVPTVIAAGTNQSTANTIIMHYDLAAQGHKLSINYTSANPLNQSILQYGANASFNYIIDQNLNDRLIITSMQRFEIIQ